MTHTDIDFIDPAVRYAVRLGADRQPHMFRYEPGIFLRSIPEDNSTWLEKSYVSGAVYFDMEVFGQWLQLPKIMTDTFELFGRSWIVIDIPEWSYLRMVCVPESLFTHLLALYMLRWYQDLGLWFQHVTRLLRRQLPWGGDLWL